MIISMAAGTSYGKSVISYYLTNIHFNAFDIHETAVVRPLKQGAGFAFSSTNEGLAPYSSELNLQYISFSKGVSSRYVFPKLLSKIDWRNQNQQVLLFFLGDDMNDMTMLRIDEGAKAFGYISPHDAELSRTRNQQLGVMPHEEIAEFWLRSIYPRPDPDHSFRRVEAFRQSLIHPKVKEARLPGLYGYLYEVHEALCDWVAKKNSIWRWLH